MEEISSSYPICELLKWMNIASPDYGTEISLGYAGVAER